MKKMLFISPELPFPAHSGGKLKSLKLIQHFATQFDVTLACPLKLEDSAHLPAFKQTLELDDYFCHPVARERSLKNLACSHARRVPLNVYRSASSTLHSDIEAAADNFDLIFVDHFEAAQYIPHSYRGHVIYHAHNTYHQMWQRFAEQPGFFLHRIAAAIESRRVRRYETQVCTAADLVFASPNDIESLQSCGAETAKFLETYHLGDDTRLDAPSLNFANTKESLMYVGYLGWEPNANGLLWFIDNVWPILRAQHPNLSLDVVGKNADERLTAACESREGINLLGFVEDLETVFSTARVNIAPLHFGSGMKVKVLDAMARGLPTVTTEVGAEGIAAINDQHLAICESADDMAAQVTRLLTDKEQWQLMSKASRELIAQRYNWPALLRSTQAAINEVLEHTSKSSGGGTPRGRWTELVNAQN